MKVLHLTSRLHNGAGIAAARLHDGLRQAGVESGLYFGTGASSDSQKVRMFSKHGFIADNITRVFTGLQARVQQGDGYVNNPRWWVSANHLPKSCDVIHIHSLFRWVDMESLFSVIPARAPIVWSLHDFEPITGGCIYPGECAGWETSCKKCPQLRSGFSWITKRNHRIKKALFSKRRINFVCNSTWTLEQASRAALLSFAGSTSMINYGLNVEAYRPVDKDTAKRALGLDTHLPVIGFASTDLSEKRKGFAVLRAALNRLGASKVMLLSFGGGQADGSLPNHVHLGPVYSVDLQRLFYSAIDIFVTPSLVETFGNTAMEAMACGTPVVGYATSGLKDVVAPSVTGMLQEPIGSEDAIWQALDFLVSHPEVRAQMGVAARRRVEECFDVRLMAARYKDLYGTLMQGASAQQS
jgi:glycosyltransferase involved in cell wall biosynthesis